MDNEIILDEVVIKIIPAERSRFKGGEVTPSGDDSPETYRYYDALVYTDIKTDSHDYRTDPEIAEGEPGLVAKLPLIATECVVVNWSRHLRYIYTFFLGEAAARKYLLELGATTEPGEAARDLFEVKGPFLHSLFEGKLGSDRPIRVWWHSDLLDLVSLPWELMAYKNLSKMTAPISFVRGLPPETMVPKVPLREKMRLAFIYEPRTTSKALLTALGTAPDNIEIKHMTGPPREALQAAVREGYELVHLVTDGTVSLAGEGTLYLRSPHKLREGESAFKRRMLRFLLRVYNLTESILIAPLRAWLGSLLEAELDIDKCPASDLCALLRGSRVRILSLSAPKSTDTDADRIDGYLLPKVYQAFSSLGSSALPLPTIIAPVGATDDPEMTHFWQEFYRELGESLEPQKAMGAGLKGQPPLAMALFLRHRDGRLFTRTTAAVSGIEPMQLDAALQFSRELAEQLKAQGGEYQSLPESFQRLISKESERQAHLEVELEPWMES